MGLGVQRFRRRTAKARSQKLIASEATAFYRRLLATLAKHGWTPTATETPREFAATVSSKLPDDSARGLVDPMTTLFYRVRFGDVPLAVDEKRQMDESLVQLLDRLTGN